MSLLVEKGVGIMVCKCAGEKSSLALKLNPSGEPPIDPVAPLNEPWSNKTIENIK